MERDACRKELSCYVGMLNAICRAVAGKHAFTPREKEEARAMMRDFKKTLDARICELQKREGDGKLNRAEEAFLLPALLEARTRVRVRWNSNPGQSGSANSTRPASTCSTCCLSSSRRAQRALGLGIRRGFSGVPAASGNAINIS